MAVRRAIQAELVPPIPTCQAETIVNDREPLLFWVRTGRAQLDVGGQAHSLVAGEALWVPAGLPHRAVVEEGSVAFPMFAPAVDLPARLNRVIRLVIPSGWEDWLVAQFAHSLGYLRGSVSFSAGLLGLVAGSCADPVQAEVAARGVAPPPLPRSRAAVDVARALLRTPGDHTSLPDFAEQLRVGVRTLQQQFATETGMPFVRWRAAARVSAAAAYLDAGRSIGWTGHHVGFTTSAGFTQAFREHTGRSPLEYTRSHRTRRRPDGCTLADELIKLSDLPNNSGISPLSAPAIPATRTWARVNNFHIVVWVYRGTARITIGDRSWRLRRGDAMWLPAGVSNSIEVAADSLLLPIGEVRGAAMITAPYPCLVHFPLMAENWLLHTLIASYTRLRPDGFDGRAMLRLVRDASQVRAAPDIQGVIDEPVQSILAAVRDSPADPRSLGEWAAGLGIDVTELHQRFVRVTGQTFPLWRAGLRMTLARRLLDGGALPGEVAGRLGYAHASGFSQVFTKAHGMSPRAYQRRHTRPTETAQL